MTKDKTDLMDLKIEFRNYVREVNYGIETDEYMIKFLFQKVSELKCENKLLQEQIDFIKTFLNI